MNDDREARKAKFITENSWAREIYMDGYEAGFVAGYKKADETAESHAEHAARIFYAMEAGEEIHRKFAKSAHNAIDVVAAREKLRAGELR